MSVPNEGASAPAAESSASEATESTVVESQESQDEEAASEEGAEAPAKKEEIKKELQKQLKKYKLKVDGKEEDFELDLNNEDEVRKHLQMSKASQKRMQEAAELKAAVEEFVGLLKKDPRKILSDPAIGLDLKKFAQDIINEQLEEEKKSPEQKEIEKLRKQLEERITKDKEDGEKKKKDDFDRLQQQAEVQLEGDIKGALETSGLPKTPYTVRKMAEIMMEALKADVDLPAAEAAEYVRKQMQSDIKELLATSNDDLLEQLLDNDIQSRLQKRRATKAKKAVETASSVKPTGQDVKPKEAAEEKKQTIKQFFGV